MPTGAAHRQLPTGRALHIVLLAMATGLFLAALDQTVVNQALPAVIGDLGRAGQASWVVTSFLLTQTVATPIIGKLSDLFGRKLVFQVTIAVFLVTSVAAGLSQSMLQLIVFRGLQGIGAGGLVSLPITIIGDIVPPADRGRYQGYIAATFATAAAAGPLVGGPIVDGLGWRWVFFINLPIGLVSMTLIQRHFFVDHAGTKRAIDFLGAGLLTAALSPLMLALTWGGKRYAWSSSTILGCFAASIIGLAIFTWWETKAAEPIVPLYLFRNSIIRTCTIGAVISGVGLFSVSFFGPIFYQMVKGLTATKSGLATIPLMCGTTIGSITSGRLIARTKRYKRYPLLGCAFVATGVIVLSTMNEHTSMGRVMLGLFLSGLGIGQIGPSLLVITQNAAPYRDMGVASSTISFGRSLGGTLGVAVLGAIYSNRLETLVPRYVGATALAKIPNPAQLQRGPEQLRAIKDVAVHDNVVRAFSDAITHAWFYALPCLILGFVVFAFVEEIPLRKSIRGDAEDHEVTGERPAAPVIVEG